MDGSRDSANEKVGNQATMDSTNIIMPKEESRDEKPHLESTSSRLNLASMNSVASIATITSISSEPNNVSECTEKKGGERQEKWWITFPQISIPFFLAGIGTIGAGLRLGKVKKSNFIMAVMKDTREEGDSSAFKFDSRALYRDKSLPFPPVWFNIQDWEVVRKVSPLLILVPPLLGLKGNLDMCLASRLSTQANLGNMTSWHEIWKMVVGNVAVVQIQAIVASLLLSIVAVIMNLIINGNFEMHHALLLAAASVTTATSSCFVLDLVMIAVVVLSYKVKMNPDNLATPLAASIGDVVSITLLANIASRFYKIHDSAFWVLIFVIVVYLLLFLPFWVIVVLRNEYTRPVLKSGWAPILFALFISGMGGLILESFEDKYKSYPVFQPIINGIGGNLVAIQASRFSTIFRQTSLQGTIPPHIAVCSSPFAALFKGMPHAATARVLIFMNIVGQTVFVFVADYIFNGEFTITLAFGTSYVFVTVLQVMILLYIAHVLIHIMWKRNIDPDNSCIPILTALADVIGSSLLALAFFFLDEIGLPYGK